MGAIDLNHGSDPKSRHFAGVVDAMDQALVSREKFTRKYLGASAVGGECGRRVQLDYISANGLPGAPSSTDKISAKTQRVFDMGHLFEELAIRWIRDAGFVLKTEAADGGQIGFSVADGRFGGHCDGVFISGPAVISYPALFEHKAVNGKSWREIVKHGLAASRPLYYSQISLYQAYLDLPNPAVFMALNKETADIYCEMVPFDADMAQRTSDQAARIIQATEAGEMLPRSFPAHDHFQCKMCGYRSFCWRAEL